MPFTHGVAKDESPFFANGGRTHQRHQDGGACWRPQHDAGVQRRGALRVSLKMRDGLIGEALRQNRFYDLLLWSHYSNEFWGVVTRTGVVCDLAAGWNIVASSYLFTVKTCWHGIELYSSVARVRWRCCNPRWPWKMQSCPMGVRCLTEWCWVVQPVREHLQEQNNSKHKTYMPVIRVINDVVNR